MTPRTLEKPHWEVRAKYSQRDWQDLRHISLLGSMGNAFSFLV